MKKVITVIAALILVLSLTGCSQDKNIYKEAGEAFEAADYAKVIELLDTIPDFDDADGLRDLADAFISFDLAAQTVEEMNAELDEAVTSAQELLDSDRVPLDESTADDVVAAISALQEIKREVPDMPDELADIIAETEKLEAPLSYSDEITSLQEAQTALDNSMKQMEQVTNPTGDFVISRISEIENIGEIEGATEDNDPNNNLGKQGGYSSATFFDTPLVTNTYGSSPLDKGTDGGGCLEVFTTVEDAEARNTYLSAFDGTGALSSGSHVVVGTIVVRTSHQLTASQQNELTEQIIDVLIELR